MAETPITSLTIVERIFSNWTALRMAVEHGNGTIDAAHGFCEYIAETLKLNEKLHYTDISGELEDYMDEIFNTKLEDDSEKQVAQDVVRFHNYIIANDVAALTTELQRLPPIQPWIIPNQNFKFTRPPKNDDSGDSSDGAEDDLGDNDNGEAENSASASKSNGGMEVDSEGWSVIRRKKK